MRAPTSATIGERTAGIGEALYGPASVGSNEALPAFFGPRPGRCRSGVRAGPGARMSRSAELPSGYGRWSRMFLAETPTRGGVARVRCASRDIRRERESESNDDRKDETTERHQWVLPTPPANLALGPSWRLSRRGA